MLHLATTVSHTCFGWPWKSGGEWVRYSEGYFSNGICLLFSTIRVALFFGGEKGQRDEVWFSYHKYISIWFVIVDIDLDHPAEIVFVSFLHCKCTFKKQSMLYSLEGYSTVKITTYFGIFLQEWFSYFFSHYLSCHLFISA